MVDWLSSAKIAAHRPDCSPSDAERLVLDTYGIESVADSLPSDRDQNFRLKTANGRQYVLRIVSNLTPVERVRLELEVLSRLNRQLGDVGVPELIRADDGRDLVQTERSNLSYLVTWLDGAPLGDALPHTRELLVELGRTAGRIDSALSPMDEQARLVSSPWDLTRAHETVAALIGYVQERERRELVDFFDQKFRNLVLPLIDRLPHQVVHNDLNDYNVLVKTESSGLRLSGVLDVGDALRSARVVDPVIAAAYAALHWNDPVGAAAAVAAGYNELIPFSDDELLVFLPFLAMRLCASVCISAHRQTEEPDDSYLTISQAPAWETLERLRKQSFDLGRYRIRAACGKEPCPQSPNVREWIDTHSKSFSTVCRYDLRETPSMTLDLSVSSPSPYVNVEEPVATREVAAAMDGAQVSVAIGRYDEVRLAYNNRLFEVPTLDGMVQRTVHLGVDLFLPTGEEIYTPLDGMVFGLADNSEDLSYGPTIVLRHEPDGCPPFYTMYGHLQRSDLTEFEVGQRVGAGALIGHIGEPSENGGWTPHLHLQVVVDMLDRRSDFPGVCAFQDRAAWTSLCPSPYRLLGLPGSLSGPPEIDPSRLVRNRSDLIGPSLSVSYDEPLAILRAAGTYMFDHTGRAYLDCVNNVNHVGHGNPVVVRAVSDQMRVLNTNTRYLHPTILEYARRLTAKLPDPLSVCFFVNSGSEANDLALRLARLYTGRNAVVVIDAAYHGHLTSLIEISPYKFDGPGGSGPSDGVYVATLPDVYRGPFRDSRASDRYVASVRECLNQAESVGGCAAFLTESLLSCGGQIELPPDYLRNAYTHAREHGSICIADEVQVGFGRVGTYFWGFETQGVVPDIVTMGKPIGNGHPLGAVVTTPEIAAAFNTGMEYFNTYGGNPVSCAAGLAVLDVIERENLQVRAHETGEYLKKRLLDLMDEYALIGDVRGRGLFLGVELVSDRELRIPAARQAAYVINRAKRLGVLLSTDGPDHNVLKIKPPLTFNRDDADRLIEVLGRVLLEDPAQP